MSPPRYQTLLKEEIPVVPLGAASYARVIAGELGGVKGPAATFTPVTVADVRLAKGQKTELTIPGGHHAAVVLLNGDVLLNNSSPVSGAAQIAVLSPEGDRVVVEAREDSTLLLLSGQPIDEPVASYGPFVMNTREEIMEAVNDYRAGRMGALS